MHFRPRPCAAHGRAGPGEDAARPLARGPDVAELQPRAVHAGPHAERHHGHGDFAGDGSAGAARVRVCERADLREHRARRRNQPHPAEDPGRAAPGDAGAEGQRGQTQLRPRETVLRPRDAKPDRARGHVSAARGAARPVHVSHQCRLPERGGGAADRQVHDGRRDAGARQNFARRGHPEISGCGAPRAGAGPRLRPHREARPQVPPGGRGVAGVD